MMKYFIFSVCIFLSVSVWAVPASKYDICLDYWKIGANGSCKATPQNKKTEPEAPKIAEKPKVAAPVSVTEIPIEPEEIEEKPERSALDKKIDEYIETYDKPPREFVAFHLEPSLENALKWVHKYNSMIKRNRDITYAWSQAEILFDKAVASGEDPKVLGLDLPPDMPDFGVPVPGMAKNPPKYTKPNVGFKPSVDIAKAMLGQNDQNITLPTPLVKESLIPGMQPNQKPLTNIVPITQDGRTPGQLHIDYYFSAECPYCQRFEPGFNSIIQEMGDKVTVTCVDMTPSGQYQENIYGKVDCDWRPIQEGEIQKMGVTRTPSLIISREAGGALERITGYVDTDKLREYLLK